MEVQSAYLFQLEDGGSLSFAVHSDVPQHERLCQTIQANRGIVVEDASAADFCVISLMAPEADAIAEELLSEGKIALHDYWIRDSVDAGQLLPWYSYQFGSPSFSSSSSRYMTSAQSVMETEERDVHELVVTSARHWQLFSTEELHRYVSRKCPHRSLTSFRNLHESKQSEIDSRVSYLRRRLDNVLSFNNDFNRKPRMSFGSPSKQLQPRIEIPATSSLARLMPTPSMTSDNLESHSGLNLSQEDHTAGQNRREVPCEPPNIDNTLPDSSTPAFLGNGFTSISQPAGPSLRRNSGTASGGQSVGGTMTQVAPGVVQTPALAPGQTLKVPGGTPVTQEDKDHLAMFMLQYPKKTGIRTHLELFRRVNQHGQRRTVGSWEYVWKQYEEEIRKIMKRKSKNGAISALKGGEMVVLVPPAPPLATAATPLPTAGAQNGKGQALGQTTAKPAYIMITDADKQALAQWMLDNPRSSKSNSRGYFERFAQQYSNGASRSAGGWEAAASRHKPDIVSRQRKILRERKLKPYKAQAHSASVSTILATVFFL